MYQPSPSSQQLLHFQPPSSLQLHHLYSNLQGRRYYRAFAFRFVAEIGCCVGSSESELDELEKVREEIESIVSRVKGGRRIELLLFQTME